MKFYDKLVNVITLIAKTFLGAMLATMLIVSVVEVIRRYFFNASFPWAEELVRFLMVWVTFIGGAVAFKDGGLVFFDLILNKFPSKVKITIQLITNTAILFFSVYMLTLAFKYTFTRSVITQIAVGLKISMSIPYLGIPTGLTLFVIYALYNYKKLISVALGKEMDT
jgi:TRAP-type C4-dicarboxylate transport system permease small subunit